MFSVLHSTLEGFYNDTKTLYEEVSIGQNVWTKNPFDFIVPPPKDGSEQKLQIDFPIWEQKQLIKSLMGYKWWVCWQN